MKIRGARDCGEAAAEFLLESERLRRKAVELAPHLWCVDTGVEIGEVRFGQRPEITRIRFRYSR